MIIDRKGLAFFGMVLVLVMSFFLLLGGVSFSRQQFCYIYGPAVQSAAAQEATNVNDLPLPKPSAISIERNAVRLDLERVTVHQYYIVYSVIYGDQSHTAYHLFLTDLNRKALDLNGVGEIWLETDEGKRIEQVAEPTVYEYPEDQPLRWKIGIIAKFPYQNTRGEHKLFLRYQGRTFELSGIRY